MAQGAQLGAPWWPRGVGWVGRNLKREGMHRYFWLLIQVVQQKPIPQCKAIILQLKIKANRRRWTSQPLGHRREEHSRQRQQQVPKSCGITVSGVFRSSGRRLVSLKQNEGVTPFLTTLNWSLQFLFLFSPLFPPRLNEGCFITVSEGSERASQVALMVKNPPANAGDIRDSDSISGSGRDPRGEQGNLLQYFCLDNPMDRGAWWATVHRVAQSWTGLKQLNTHMHAHTHTHTHTHTSVPKGSNTDMCFVLFPWKSCFNSMPRTGVINSRTPATGVSSKTLSPTLF